MRLARAGSLWHYERMGWRFQRWLRVLLGFGLNSTDVAGLPGSGVRYTTALSYTMALRRYSRSRDAAIAVLLIAVVIVGLLALAITAGFRAAAGP